MKKPLNKKKLLLLAIVLSAYTVVVTPLLIMNLQKQQQIRSNAQTATTNPLPTPTPTPTLTLTPTPGLSCVNSPSDALLILDKSGSMNDKIGTNGTKITNAKTAASNFIDILSKDTHNRSGLVSFETTATLNSPLTTNYNSVKTQINSLTASGNTCIQCAIDQANKELLNATNTAQANGRIGIKKVAILLTDGIANTIEGSPNRVDQITAEQKALAAAQTGHTNSGTIFFTIGLGTDVNTDFLKKIASTTGGQYYLSPTTDQLNSIYQQISQVIAQSSIKGTIFNDSNDNGVFEPTEQKLSGWTLQLYTSGLVTPTKTITSDNSGTFNLTGLCDGSYTLKELTQTGWNQTLPANPLGYVINIVNGSSVTDKNFGNYQTPAATPTASFSPTPSTTSTTVSLNVLLHGIGNSGDNSNQTQSSLSNKNPLHPVTPADIQIFNTQNQLVASGAGSVKYNPNTGSYQSSLISNGGNLFQTGKYNIKVKTAYHLRRLLPGIQTITIGQNNQMPTTSLVAGDINNDNTLNIQDYNTLLDCYSDLAAAPACSDQPKKTSADLNDDGSVSQIDYNLFLREISTQPGE